MNFPWASPPAKQTKQWTSAPGKQGHVTGKCPSLRSKETNAP
jgi:hypothetical protein